jgi:hypothetical protein
MTSECTVDGCLWSDRSTASAVNHIGGVMVSVLASSAVDHGLSSDWVKPKDTREEIVYVWLCRMV